MSRLPIFNGWVRIFDYHGYFFPCCNTRKRVNVSFKEKMQLFHLPEPKSPKNSFECFLKLKGRCGLDYRAKMPLALLLHELFIFKSTKK
jgi:hypothetical protein